MKKVVLGNIDYECHLSSEGDQLQQGLRQAGWALVGPGYFRENLKDVPEIMRKHSPDVVLVHDKRDFDPTNAGSFRKDIGFRDLDYLAHYPAFKLAVVKDAGGMQKYHQDFCEEIAADAVVVYYHPESVLAHSPFLAKYPLIRIYHSVDAEYIRTLNFNFTMRRLAIVTGAVSPVYPLRERAFKFNQIIGCDTMQHPGYDNRGSMTPSYLMKLAQYRVHIATASRYGFALRKIIESVAMGATPVTDLPAYDVLPEIDGALVRISANANPSEIKQIVWEAADKWNVEERRGYQRKALEFYDWRVAGRRLSYAIDKEREMHGTEN